MSGAVGAVLVGVLGLVGIVHFMTIRYSVLPKAIAAAKTQKSLDAALVLGYVFPLTPAIFGVCAVIFVGEWWLILPFAAMSICAWLVIRSYLQEALNSRTGPPPSP